MPSRFQQFKKRIDGFLLRFLDEKKDAFTAVNDFGPDLLDRIKKMAVAGKTIRGSLVMLYGKPEREAVKLAAAMELLQTALIIHDDIMDRDSTRRGMPSIHTQYKRNDLAMCAGDVLFFLAFELIGSVQTDAVTLGRIVRFVGREYQYVGVAQMADVTGAAKTKLARLALYTYKTARYTFAVPLMLGAILTGTTKETLRYLESFGEAAGVLFQIRDDQLDGDETFGQTDIDGLAAAATESAKRLNNAILFDLLAFVMKRTK